MATDARPQRTRPWVMRTYSGHSTARASNELYRTNLAKGQTGPLHRLRPAHPDRLRPRRPRGGAARSARSACRWRTWATWRELLDGIPVAEMNTSMTINATAAWLLGLYVAHAEDTRRRPDAAARARRRTTSSRSTCSRGTYIFPPGPSLRLIVDTIAYTVRQRAQVEPDQRVQLPPAGGGRDAGAGDRLRAGHRHRRARRRARLGQDRRRRAARRGRSHQLLRERRRPLRRGDLQDAGLHPAVGPHLPRALRRRGPQAPPLPLRRAGQLARADRAAAGEQRAAHRARVARRDAVEERPGPGHAAAGLERGARPAPALGPAVVAAHAAGPRLRVRPARVRRHLRGLAR